MSDQPPLVTIGICCYNASDTIKRAIWSAINQTYRPVEIIIVDDASKDDSQAVIQDLAAFANKLGIAYHFIQNKINKGVAASRNIILQNAKGTYVVFFDDDDYSLANRVERQVHELLAQGPEYVSSTVCYCSRTIINNGQFSYEPAFGSFSGGVTQSTSLIDRLVFGRFSKAWHGTAAACSMAGHIDVYNKLGGFDERFRRSEDTEFNFRHALSGGRFIGIEDPLVEQYTTEGDDKGEQLEKHYHRLFLDKHKSIFTSSNMGLFCLQFYEIRFQSKYIFILFFILFLKNPFKFSLKMLWILRSRLYSIFISFRRKYSWLFGDG